mmetsp:Transcript_17504/g.28422  ORF Transcript_17504/g.28422 Transcript_17504/m.28422 type:complete len:216 (+) Transcript_17504:71-718(+)
MADEEPMEFDFGKKKSKKEKAEKKEKKEKKEKDDTEGGEGGEGKMVEIEWERGTVYTYDFLLARLYEIIEDKNPSLGVANKTSLKPPQVVRVGSKKVGWVNFQEICDMMNRSTDHVTQFVLAEFGTEGSNTADGQLILKGRYQPKHMESLLKKYMKEFVICQMCKSKDTELARDNSTRLHVVSCANCGASRTALSIKSGYHAVTRADRRAAKAAK